MIIERLGPEGTLIGIDQDDKAIQWASKVFANAQCEVKIVKDNFRNLNQILDRLGIKAVDGVLFDLGVSSPQLDEGERGFSFHVDAPLDMRMDQTAPLSAFEIVNQWPESELVRILKEYGEERFAHRIVRAIGKRRKDRLIATTTELAKIVKEAIPAANTTSGTPSRQDALFKRSGLR